MKINLNKIDIEKINELLNIKEDNIYISSLINELMTTETKYFDNDLDIKNKLIDLISPSDEDNSLINEHLVINKLDINKYMNNPYNKLINNISDIKYKDYEITYSKYKPYELFIDNEITILDNYKEIVSLGYFTKPYKYLTLNKRNVPWMLITPNEINTMEDSINLVKGNIITFGLGLGYFQFMASLKKEVNKIYVIEKDSSIINLFNTYLLNKFKYKDKIEIIKSDAINFLDNELNKYQFDFAFIDLYHNANDGLDLYLKFKNKEKYFRSARFLYWLETSLISLVRRILLTFIVEQYEEYEESEYKINKTSVDRLLTKLFYKYQNTSLNSFNDVLKFISTTNILKILMDL